MQETTTSVTGSTPIEDRWSLAKVGTAAVAAAAVLDVYAAYGDSQRQTNQTAAVPFLIAVCAVVAALGVRRGRPQGAPCRPRPGAVGRPVGVGHGRRLGGAPRGVLERAAPRRRHRGCVARPARS